MSRLGACSARTSGDIASIPGLLPPYRKFIRVTLRPGRFSSRDVRRSDVTRKITIPVSLTTVQLLTSRHLRVCSTRRALEQSQFARHGVCCTREWRDVNSCTVRHGMVIFRVTSLRRASRDENLPGVTSMQ